MNTESDTESNGRRGKRSKRCSFGYNVVIFIVSLGLYIFNLVIAVPVLQTCFLVAVFVMIVGTVLGLIQLVPEFPRKFMKLEPETARKVDYIYFVILVIRTVWLIAATVVVNQSECTHIRNAYVSIYVNWGIFGVSTSLIILVAILRFLRGGRGTRL